MAVRVLVRCPGCGTPAKPEKFEQTHTAEIRINTVGGRGQCTWESAPLDAETALSVYRQLRGAAGELRAGLMAAGIDPDQEMAA